MRPELREPAVVHHADAVGAGRGGQTVRDDNDGAPLHEVLERLLHGVLGAGIEVRRRLVEDQYRRIGQRGAGQRDELALPRRQA